MFAIVACTASWGRRSVRHPAPKIAQSYRGSVSYPLLVGIISSQAKTDDPGQEQGHGGSQNAGQGFAGADFRPAFLLLASFLFGFALFLFRLFEVIVRQESEFLLNPGQRPVHSLPWGAASSSLPVTPLMDHSRPSGWVEANQDKIPPVTTANSASPSNSGLWECDPGRGGSGRQGQDFRVRLPDKAHHRRGDQTLHDADGQVYGLHQEDERWKRTTPKRRRTRSPARPRRPPFAGPGWRRPWLPGGCGLGSAGLRQSSYK